MYKTKNDLPEERRKQLIEILNNRLADCVDLRMQAKQAHRNVKGPSFIALHKLFDEVADTAEEDVDLIAERVVQLRGIAEGTVRVAGQRSTLGRISIEDWRGEGPRRSTFKHSGHLWKAGLIRDGQDCRTGSCRYLGPVHRSLPGHRQTTLVCRSPFARQLILLTGVDDGF